MIYRHQSYTDKRPANHEHNPQTPSEGRLVLVVIATCHLRQLFLAKVRKAGWDNILHSSAGVRPSYADEYFQVLRNECHYDRQGDRGEWKNDPVHDPGVGSSFAVKQILKIVTEGYGNDREIGAEGENGKQCEEISHKAAGGFPEVERIQVVQVLWAEGKDGGEGQQSIKNQDYGEVSNKEQRDTRLVLHWCD